MPDGSLSIKSVKPPRKRMSSKNVAIVRNDRKLQRPISSHNDIVKENTEQTYELFSKKSTNDSNANFWNKYNYYDNNDQIKGNNNGNNKQNKNGKVNNTNQDIVMTNSSNNLYASEEKGLPNIKKYSPYINKKNY